MGAAGCKAALMGLMLAACTSINADARTFENTRWHVTAINGRTTPSTGNYEIGFEKGQIGGQFGCNHFGGEYRLARDILATSAIRMTMMACSEPAASFESAGSAILSHPMRMMWSGDAVTLSNGAGSIDLQRAQ